MINALLGKTTNQNNAIHKMLKHDKKMTINKDEIRNILNDYFVNIGPNLSAKIINLYQGWATVLVSGPHAGRRSPSRAGLLNGSS